MHCRMIGPLVLPAVQPAGWWRSFHQSGRRCELLPERFSDPQTNKVPGVRPRTCIPGCIAPAGFEPATSGYEFWPAKFINPGKHSNLLLSLGLTGLFKNSIFDIFTMFKQKQPQFSHNFHSLDLRCRDRRSLCYGRVPADSVRSAQRRAEPRRDKRHGAVKNSCVF